MSELGSDFDEWPCVVCKSKFLYILRDFFILKLVYNN
jgi:hypothetical protein